MKVGLIIQARISSARLPGKALLDLGGFTVLTRVVQRMSVTGLPIVVATSDAFEDDVIEYEVLSKTNASVYRGSLNNVRDRFYQCALENKFDVIVRVTADNPFSEPSFVSDAVEKINEGAHYVRARPTLCPDGSNIEAFRFTQLQISSDNDPDNIDKYDIEHVTPEIRKRLSGSKHFMEFSPDSTLGALDNDIHLGIDTIGDYIKIRRIYHLLGEVSGKDHDLLHRVVLLFKENAGLFKRGRRHEF